MKNAFAAKAANQNDTVLIDLERQLKAMAQGHQAAPQKSTAKPAADKSTEKSVSSRDGMLGTLLFDCIFGAPLSDFFAEAVDHLPTEGDPALSALMAVDIYDEFRQDRAKKDRTNDRGVDDKGVKGSVNGMFNRLGTGALNDAPKRLNLEDQYSVIARMKRAPGLYMAA